MSQPPNNPPIAMRATADLGALLQLVDNASSLEAQRGLLLLIAQSEAGRHLSSDMASMISDLFGGSNPRQVAEAARGALAYYGVTSQLGRGADILRQMREDNSNKSQ